MTQISPEDLKYILSEEFLNDFSELEQIAFLNELVENELRFSKEWHKYRSRISPGKIQDLQHSHHNSFFENELESERLVIFADYHQCDGFNVIGVPQNCLIKEEKIKNPIFYTTLSTCTSLIATDGIDVYFAHAGFSEKEQVEETLEFLSKKGISNDDVYIVIPENSKGWGRGFERQRVMSESSDYARYDMNESNIIAYEGAHDRVIRVFATGQKILTCQYDLDDSKKQKKDNVEVKTLYV